MIINVASFGGRSHLLDTARELEKFGHEVRFYSFVPDKRAGKFGLKKNNNHFLILSIPFVIYFKLFGFYSLNRRVLVLYRRLFDYITAWVMKPCDIFIGQSPMHLYSLKYAKKKYGAITILERGTSHVLEQVEALVGNPALKGKKPMRARDIELDMEGYYKADFISVGADHVKQSFLKNGFSTSKIFVNNYGVTLDEFEPTELNDKVSYDIIIVGTWSYRKGCDLLIEVCTQYSLSLLHVGSIGDMQFPKSKLFKHIDAVPQKELLNYYSEAKIFVLPSREEGLALVQLQALVCGLPIICSKKSGGRDLRIYCDNSKYIIELEKLNINCLFLAIEEGLKLSNEQKGYRNYVNNNVKKASWQGYGERYNDFLEKISVLN